MLEINTPIGKCDISVIDEVAVLTFDEHNEISNENKNVIREYLRDMGKYERVVKIIRHLLKDLQLGEEKEFPITIDDIRKWDFLEEGKKILRIRFFKKGHISFNEKKKEISDMIKNIERYRELKEFISFIKKEKIDSIDFFEKFSAD